MIIPENLTTKEAIELLGKLDDDDAEVAHMNADAILLAVLRSYGFHDVVEAFRSARNAHGFYYS